MAKAKKTSGPTTKQEATSTSATSATSSNSPFNADAAAQSVAALLASRAKQGKSEGLKTESAAFSKLKQSIATPQVSANSILSDSGKSHKPQQGSGFARQVGHNQTRGASGRTGVPRRTAG